MNKNDLGVSFSLSKDQTEVANNWFKDHREYCTIDDVGAIGGRYKYEFIPTGLGTIENVVCSCGAKLELTDFRCW